MPPRIRPGVARAWVYIGPVLFRVRNAHQEGGIAAKRGVTPRSLREFGRAMVLLADFPEGLLPAIRGRLSGKEKRAQCKIDKPDENEKFAVSSKHDFFSMK